MSKRTTKMKLGEGLNQDRTDWKRLDAMSDEDIDYSDIPALDDEFFENAEVVRAGLRLLEEHERKVEALRQALLEGEESGDDGELDMEAIKREARKEALIEAEQSTASDRAPQQIMEAVEQRLSVDTKL